jgi:hypothetical protein
MGTVSIGRRAVEMGVSKGIFVLYKNKASIALFSDKNMTGPLPEGAGKHLSCDASFSLHNLLF